MTNKQRNTEGYQSVVMKVVANYWKSSTKNGGNQNQNKSRKRLLVNRLNTSHIILICEVLFIRLAEYKNCQ